MQTPVLERVSALPSSMSAASASFSLAVIFQPVRGKGCGKCGVERLFHGTRRRSAKGGASFGSSPEVVQFRAWALLPGCYHLRSRHWPAQGPPLGNASLQQTINVRLPPQ